MKDRTMLYRDNDKVNINTKDLPYWIECGWSKVKKEKPNKKKFEKSKED